MHSLLHSRKRLEPFQVYCSCAMAGSPASFHGVPSLHFITAINDSQVKAALK